MRIENFSFGSIEIDGRTYAHDVVIDRGRFGKRRKGASKRHRDSYGHTPLSADEQIPWSCRRLVIGTGAAGALPVMAGGQGRSTTPRRRAGDGADQARDRSSRE